MCQRVLRGVGDAQRSASTPCARFDVDELVEHLLGSIVALGAMAGADVVVPEGGTVEARVAAASQQALEAWRRRGTDGEVSFGGSPLPAWIAAGILSIELLVHAWDLARATSQPVVASDPLSAYVLEVAREVVAPNMRDGDRFAPEVELGPDGTPLERLVAFTGRTP